MAYEMRISDWSSDVCSSDLDVFVRLLSKVIVVTSCAVRQFLTRVFFFLIFSHLALLTPCYREYVTSQQRLTRLSEATHHFLCYFLPPLLLNRCTIPAHLCRATYDATLTCTAPSATTCFEAASICKNGIRVRQRKRARQRRGQGRFFSWTR